jgi:hypothetical protein
MVGKRSWEAQVGAAVKAGVMKEGAVEWGVVSGVTNANQGRCHAWLVLVASVILINHYRAVLTQVLIG